MLIHWIWLAHHPGLNDRTKAALLERFPDPEDIFFASSQELDAVEGLSQNVKEALQDKNLTQAEEILADCEKEKLHILTFRDAAYPTALKQIADPPMVLYYKGTLPDFDSNPVIAVVGTRKASAYGLTTAKRMGYQIARCGGIVVSGLAFGVDAMAMSGALTAGGKTVGVLGCGADIVYPRSNKSLFADTEQYGCILSEFAPGMPPLKQNFPKRNRIISGLSDGVLVVEAPERSGALITARQAAEQGRDVFTVPGNIDQPSFVGSNRLLRDGATLASTGWDVVSEYQQRYPDKVRKDLGKLGLTEPALSAEEGETKLQKVAQKPRLPEKKKDLKKKLDKKVIDKEPTSAYSDVNTSLPKLSAREQAIVDVLKTGEMLADDVIAETGMTAGTLLAALTMLEIKGVIVRLPGKRVALKK